MCGRRLTISYIDTPPYSTGNIFESIVEGGCGRSCVKFDVVRYYTNNREVRLSRRNSSDFILPFLGSSSAVELYGYHFIPFTDVPQVYYITPKHASALSKMVNKCRGLYTLIFLWLMACTVSGFIVWALEYISSTKQTKKQSFFRGLFDGFWWSFTTVTSGFGAKIIQSTPAKLYTALWILGGVIIFSLLTSTFTAELMQYMGDHRNHMSGATVGVLKYREYEASLAVHQGAVIKETEAKDFHADLLELLRMLRTHQVSGILLDKYTLVYARGYLQWMKGELESDAKSDPYDVRIADIRYFTGNTEHRLKEYDGDKLSYGVLVKNLRDYRYLNGAVRDNRLSLETATESAMNQLFPRDSEEDAMDLQDALSQNDVLIWLGLIVGCICLFGFTYETYFSFCHRNNPTAKNYVKNTIRWFLSDDKKKENEQLNA